MTTPMQQRLGAASGIVFPIAMFLAVGNGSHFTPWRAVAATWALILALPFLAYLFSLLRAAEGEGGWVSTLALVAGVSGILLKLASHAPELAIHRDGIEKGTQLYKALDNTAGAATLMSLYPLAICCAAVAAIPHGFAARLVTLAGCVGRGLQRLAVIALGRSGLAFGIPLGMGRAGIEPATLGLKVPCSTN